MSTSITSFHLFFGLPFFQQSIWKSLPLTVAFRNPPFTCDQTKASAVLSNALRYFPPLSFHESPHLLLYPSPFYHKLYEAFSFLQFLSLSLNHLVYSSSFELDVLLCSVTVIPIQHRSCFVCMSFVKLGHHNG